MKPDYSKLPKSWGVKVHPDKIQLLVEKLEPFNTKGIYSIEGTSPEYAYGITTEGAFYYLHQRDFDHIYTIEEFIQLTEGTDQQETLPDKWYVLVESKNDKPANDWANDTFHTSFEAKTGNDRVYIYDSTQGCCGSTVCSKPKPGYTEISFDTFQHLVLNQQKQQPTMSTNLNDKVKVPREFIEAAATEATKDQKERILLYVDFFTGETTKEFIKNFYDNQVQSSCKWKRKLEEAFPFLKEDRTTRDSQGRIMTADEESLIRRYDMGEYGGKSFELSKSYQWEIKVDKYGVQCLIPTKK